VVFDSRVFCGLAFLDVPGVFIVLSGFRTLSLCAWFRVVRVFFFILGVLFLFSTESRVALVICLVSDGFRGLLILAGGAVSGYGRAAGWGVFGFRFCSLAPSAWAVFCMLSRFVGR